MNINFMVSVCGKYKSGYTYCRDNETSKQFDIDLPDDLGVLPDFSPMINGVIQAAIAEHKILVSTQDTEEAK